MGTPASVSDREVSFTVMLDGKNTEQVEREIGGYVAYLRTHLDRLRNEQQPHYNEPLLNTIRQLIAARRNRLQARGDVVGGLKYKTRN
jgi:hypothetical protein